MISEFGHISVMLREAVDGLDIKEDGIYIDGTLGGGGHSCEIAKRLNKGGKLIGFDRDAEAIEAASERLRKYSDTDITLLRDNFENAAARINALGVTRIDGVLLDLGVSSRQFDSPGRGFSYRVEAPLDMRMDRDAALTARDILNDWEEREIFHILRDYGEETFASNIARHIVKVRERERIETTTQLNDIIDAAIPKRVRARESSHPARKTYQALRIAVNGELDALETALDSLVDVLGDGGRFVVITFHSLEDRMVKQRFKEWENPCICPPGFPECVCGRKSKGRVVTRKPVTPTEAEVEDNRRSRSAKLRIFERMVQTG